MLPLKGLLCVLLAMIPAHSEAAPITVATVIKQTYDLATFIQGTTSLLLTTYLEAMGSPFSDPDFYMPELELEGLPVATIRYTTWRGLSHQQRLATNYQAYVLYQEFLQLVIDDQQVLGPALGPGELQEQLSSARAQTQGLLSNLASLTLAMGYPLPAVQDPLGSTAYDTTNFERKVRGYVICREFKDWIDRTQRDFKLLSYYFPA